VSKRSARRGFTLLEAMVVVAIIAVLATIAVSSIQRTRGRLNAERAVVHLRGMIAKAQTLALVAGARIGTPALTNGGSCGGTNNFIEVRVIDAAQVEVPVALVPATLPDGRTTLTVECEIFDLDVRTDGTAQITTPPGTFQFTSNGRLAGLPGGGWITILAVGTVDPSRPYGFSVLPSGVMCSSSELSPPAATPCNEDV
jgi:prepilin-type N-terminal cleavage/methylation domain-containing protein